LSPLGKRDKSDPNSLTGANGPFPDFDKTAWDLSEDFFIGYIPPDELTYAIRIDKVNRDISQYPPKYFMERIFPDRESALKAAQEMALESEYMLRQQYGLPNQPGWSYGDYPFGQISIYELPGGTAYMEGTGGPQPETGTIYLNRDQIAELLNNEERFRNDPLNGLLYQGGGKQIFIDNNSVKEIKIVDRVLMS
jgi:hypothetical protein